MSKSLVKSQDQEEIDAEVQRMIREHNNTLSDMGTPWDRKKQALFHRMDNHLSTHQKEQKFQGDILAFFKEKYNIDLKGYFCPRYELPNILKSQDFQQESIVVYGVDFMSPERLFNYFKHNSPSNIAWINDSTCKVSFPMCSLSKKAIKDNLSSNYNNTHKISRGIWYPLKSYMVMGLQRSLEARISTVLDLPVSRLVDSKYPIFEEARKAFVSSVEKAINTPFTPAQSSVPPRWNRPTVQPIMEDKCLEEFLKSTFDVPGNANFHPFSTVITDISHVRSEEGSESFLRTVDANEDQDDECSHMTDRSLLRHFQCLQVSTPRPAAKMSSSVRKSPEVRKSPSIKREDSCVSEW